MGMYLITSLCLAHQGGKAARLHGKLKYLLAILRTLPCLVSPLRLSRNSSSRVVPPLPLSPTLIFKSLPKCVRSKGGGFGWLSSNAHRNRNGRALKCSPCLRVSAAQTYSSSSSRQKTFKGEAPVGIWEEGKAALQLGYLGERLEESFQHLSRHINTYFKGSVMPVQSLCSPAGMEARAQEPKGRVQMHSQRQRLAIKKMRAQGRESEGNLGQAKVQEANQMQEPPADQAGQEVQLFHISSLTTRFGESYSYVARQINFFFRRFTQDIQPRTVIEEMTLPKTRGSRGRRVSSQVGVVGRGSGLVQLKKAACTEQDSGPVETEDPRMWEECFLHFSRRINSYFGAKATDMTQELEVQEGGRFHSDITVTQVSDQQRSPPDSTIRLSSPSPATSQEAMGLQARSPGLFHISTLATSFGESYAQMANHINYYFKGQESWEGEAEGEEAVEDKEVEPIAWQDARYTENSSQRKETSFIQCLLEPRTAISDLLGNYLGAGMREKVAPPTSTVSPAWSRQVFGRSQVEEKTRFLVRRLQQSPSPTSLTTHIEELNEHLILYPACKAVAWQEKTVLLLLGQRRFHGDNQELQGAIREALALIGYVDSVKGRGIRILSIDGGGTRGVVPLQVLKRLEVATGRQVHQLFDYVCGVSTGAVLAFMLGLARISLEECEEMYHRFGSEIFRQNPLVGTMKMGWTHSYYNTATWEGLLREKMGNEVLIKTARDKLSPKVSAVSAVVNWGTTPKPFVFRNYNHAPGRLSHYAGSSGYQLWQAVRASSAAPGYFQEFLLHSDIHQDGALILNNPCALAVHECRLLWPARPFQCVLSLGTGRYDNAKRGPATSTSLRAKLSNLISSATDTEGVHTLLDDLLSANVYFRFNPMLSTHVSLDESRPGTLDLLRADTQLYLDRNQQKVERLCRVLGPERGPLQLAGDWIGERAWELQQRWT